ncbi:uncharacterized protein ACRADG_002281 [Cochliomyia hominivorax]
MFFIGILLCLTYFVVATKAKSQYIVDIIDVEWNITTTNNCDMYWKLSQPTRGIFAISGYLDFKEDINTDKATGKVDIYYSSNAITYMLTPFRIPPTIFTDGVNFLYKHFLMDTMLDCCENAINFEDKFVAPLTKRRMTCENCELKSDNFPSHLRPGFYRMVGTSVGEIVFGLTITMKLEVE